ncbi:hypothetical protein FOA52_001340 [Chlamydomonas sp. UWO 241]|nr:hypothetical protein FOA52_001340 [Chlamydomonas sp. UWO 241]
MPCKVLLRCKVDGELQSGEQELATLFGDVHVELPMLLQLRCPIDGVLQSYEQRASLRLQAHDTALWLKDPMLSIMRGRRTLSWSLAPAQGGAGSLPELTVELGNSYTRRRPPPASQSLPSQPTTRVTGSCDHTASDLFDGSDSGDDEQAHGLRGRKRSAIAAATNAAAAAAEAPPAKKGRSQAHGQELPSGAAKDAQKRNAPSEQPPVTAATSSLRGVSPHGKNWASKLYDSDTRSNIHVGVFGSEEEAAHAHDRVSIVFKGAEAKTNFPLTHYAQELHQLKKMTRKEVVAHVRHGSSALIKGASKYRGVKQTKSGRWQAHVKTGGRMVSLGTHGTEEDAARVFDFARGRDRGAQGKPRNDIGDGLLCTNGTVYTVRD